MQGMEIPHDMGEGHPQQGPLQKVEHPFWTCSPEAFQKVLLLAG